MTVEVGWYNDNKSAIAIDFYANWTWEEFYSAKERLCAILHTLNILMTYPEEILDWPSDTKVHLRYLAQDDSDKINKVIIVGANEIVFSMYNLLRRTAGKLPIHNKIQFVNSLEELNALIA